MTPDRRGPGAKSLQHELPVPESPDEAATAALGRQLAEQIALRDIAESRLTVALQQMDVRQKELRIVEELSQIGSFHWSVPTGAVWWSDQAKALLSRNPGGVPPTLADYLALVHPEDRDRLLADTEAAVLAVGEYDVRHRLVIDGRIRQFRSLGRVELGPDGPGVTGSVQDVTDVEAASTALRESRDRLAGVLDAATEQSIIATDADGLITVFNTGAERILGYTAAEVLGTGLWRLHAADEIAARATVLGLPPDIGVVFATARGGVAENCEWTYLTKDGRRRLAQLTINAMWGPNRELTGYITVGTDITERVRAQKQLRSSEIRFRDMFEFAPNGMMLIGISGAESGRFLRVNPALCQLTGYSEAELLTMSATDLTHSDHVAEHRARFNELAAGADAGIAQERHWVHRDGHELWVQLSVSPVRSRRETYVVGQVEDITARKQAEARLTHQALHDWLTGLPNRLLLMDRIELALAASTRSGRQVGVLYIDLDGFKRVNDTGGHAAGDHTLIHIGDRIRHVVRPGDTVARLGGDEFVVVCNELDDIDIAMHIAERVLMAIKIPHTHLGQTYSLSASIGVSISRPGSVPDQMLREADEAMYAGKAAGKSRVRINGIHQPAPESTESRAARAAQVEAELRDAIYNEQLVLYGQTIHDIRTRRIVAVEHLLRWHHPVRGVLPPAEFLDIAEATDLMVPIGRRVIDESCRIARTWYDTLGVAAPPVHVNVSGRQLESGNLLNDVLDSLHRHGLPATQLVLELTEAHVPLLADSMRHDLSQLRARGVCVAIDDLGTGYSSLSRLTELPVDILKIDLRFIAQMDTDPASRAIVQGILAIGRSLKLTVVSEGIETADQAEELRTSGCDCGQGFHFSRPVPEGEVRQLLAQLA